MVEQHDLERAARQMYDPLPPLELGWRQRLAARLGFRHRDELEPLATAWPERAYSVQASRTTIELDWKERLLVLLSGRVALLHVIHLDVQHRTVKQNAGYVILPPGADR